MDILKKADIQTPAYVFSENELVENLDRAGSIAKENNCHLLYSMKSLEYTTVLKKMLNHIEGFAASSLFEVKLARELLGSSGSVHYTTPGIRYHEVGELAELCDYVTLNSATHWKKLSPYLAGRAEMGIRINPGVSVVKDERYDPCASSSRLGMHIPEFRHHLRQNAHLMRNVSGIHIHTNCEGTDFGDLSMTIHKVSEEIGDVLNDLEWFNIGGGYFFDECENYEEFKSAVEMLQNKHGLKVFMEPGGTIVRSAGYIVSTIIDIVGPSDEKIALLDTTVNHVPEVYEYEYKPNVIGSYNENDNEDDEEEEEGHRYILAGSSCLAGDKFGNYGFDEPLKIGQKLIFKNMGCYALVKAHMFNGINLPSIYYLEQDGTLKLERRFTYDDFLARCTPNKPSNME